MMQRTYHLIEVRKSKESLIKGFTHVKISNKDEAKKEKVKTEGPFPIYAFPARIYSREFLEDLLLKS